MDLSISDLSFIVKYIPEKFMWEAKAREFPATLNIRVLACQPDLAMTALVLHVNELLEKLDEAVKTGQTLTGADWEKSMADTSLRTNKLVEEIKQRTARALTDEEELKKIAARAWVKYSARKNVYEELCFVYGFKEGVAIALKE